MRTTMVWMVLVVLATGCSKASREYRRCVALGEKDDLQNAIMACREAEYLDPQGDVGKKAADHVRELGKRLYAKTDQDSLRQCEPMCDHAIACVAKRLGVPATGNVVLDARVNCVADCRGTEANDRSSKTWCWLAASCDKITSEQGLMRKPCP